MTADDQNRRLEELRYRTLRELEHQHDVGRMRRDEFDRRATRARSARSAAELRPLIADLALGARSGEVVPAPAAHAARAAAPVPAASAEDSELVVAVMSGSVRDGEWDPPATVNAFALMGGVKLDFRDCRLAHDVVRVHAYAIMGGVSILVPPDVQVSVRGFGLMGGFGRVRRAPPEPGAPHIVVDGFALMGGVDVKVREPGEDERND